MRVYTQPVELTPRQLEAVRALLVAGSPKGAAETLGISPLTVRNHLADARLRLRVETNEQLVYVLSRRGKLVGPGRRAGRPGEMRGT